MERKKVITVNDFQRLTGLLETSLNVRMPEITSRLSKELTEARMLPQERISENVITMNSRVLLRDKSSQREAELTITYPQDADHRARRISVFSTIGIALLGERVGEVVSWKVPAGKGQFEIIKITYQPEAEGDYSL